MHYYAVFIQLAAALNVSLNEALEDLAKLLKLI